MANIGSRSDADYLWSLAPLLKPPKRRLAIRASLRNSATVYINGVASI